MKRNQHLHLMLPQMTMTLQNYCATHYVVPLVGVCAHGRNILSVVRDHKVHLGCAQDKQDKAVDQKSTPDR